MELEVEGLHALLFDDDVTAAFVNSSAALVEWNSLLIDRFDVRHLLQHPPPPLRRRRDNPSSPTSLEPELDQERYLDLPPSSDDQVPSSLLESGNGAELAVGGAYKAVSFSYGNPDVSTDQKDSAVGLGYSGFLPPFSVPESLLQNLPPTEKVHQIIARTAIFVSKQGGQSEFVLNVKQGDNPTFGFLIPDHHLHAYFRFLVDHPELLNSGIDDKPRDEKKKGSGQKRTGDVAGGALSLLGSVYGSGDDEDDRIQVVLESKEKEPGQSLDISSATFYHGSERAESSVDFSGNVDGALKNPNNAAKEKTPSLKTTQSVTTVNVDTTCHVKRGETLTPLGFSVGKALASALPSTSKVEPLVLEPPSHLKRMVDKVVEFILKIGKEFEAVLKEQDRKNGRFPFLLPSNQYHPYYLKLLQEAQESNSPGKSSGAQKHDSMEKVGSKKAAVSKDNYALSEGSSVYELPFDSTRKEKFKMVIGGSKKDVQDPISKPTQEHCGVSVDEVAAILQAATRGLRYPKLDILPRTSVDDLGVGLTGDGGHPASKPTKEHCGASVDEVAAILLAATRGLRYPKLDILPRTSVDDSGLGLSGEGGHTSSFGSLSLSRARRSTSKPVPNGEPSVSIPIDKSKSVGQPEKKGGRTSVGAVAKAAKMAAIEAASEADSSEACLTREQKQRAERLKRAKMFSAMIKGGTTLHAKDILPHLSTEPPDLAYSSLLDSCCKASTLDGAKLVPDTSNLSGAETDLVGREREGSPVPVDASTCDRMDKDSDDSYRERRLRKKHRSRSRRLDENNDDDDDDGRDHEHDRKKHRSHHSSHHSRDDRKHRKRHPSPNCRESRHQHRHHSISEDKHRHRSRSDNHRRSHSKRKVESKDEEINTKVSAHSNIVRVDDSPSREASLDLSNDPQEGADIQPSDTIEASDNLKAKVRAMLLATM